MAGKYNPNNEYVFYNLGCAYLKIGDLKKAKSAFIRALELNNKIADFHFNMAYVYKKLGKEKQAKIFLDNYNKLTGQVN
jgi:tetratricopeptide (TPR) repeat protein